MNSTLFNINPLPTWIYDLSDHAILKANKSALDTFGFSELTFLSLRIKDLIPSIDVNRFLTPTHKDENLDDEPLRIFTHVKENNVQIQIEVIAKTIQFDAKNCLLIVAKDVTKNLENELKMNPNDERITSSIMGQFEYVGIIDKEGIYTYVSPSSSTILGLEPESFIGKNILHFIHPDDAKRVSECFKKVIEKDLEIINPFRAKNERNQWRWIEAVLTNKLENPAVNGIVVNKRDVTIQMEEKRKSILLESVITHTNDAILITEAEPFDEPGPKILYVNEAFTRMTGYDAQEVIGKTPRILQGPKSDFEALSKLGTAIRNWQAHEITTINYKKNGEEFWINFTVTPVADEKGWFTHWVAIERDVTEHKKAEENLISTTERLRLATNSVKMGIWDWNLEKNTLTWDDRMYELFGVEKSTTKNTWKLWHEGIHSEDVEKTISNLNLALSGKFEYNAVFRVVWPDQSVHFIESNAIVSRGIDGKPIRMIGGNIDITQRKKTEEDILKANERFEKVTEATNDTIWDWDIENDQFYRSNAIERFFGKNAKKMMNSKNFWSDSFHPDDIYKIKNSIQEALANPEVNKWKQEFRIINENGKTLYAIDQGVIIRNEKGKAIRMVGAMTDITEQKKAEAENRFKANLLKTVGEASIATNLDGMVNYWNKAAEKIYGWTEDEAIGKDINLLRPRQLNPEQEKHRLSVILSGQTWSGECMVQRKDGTKFPIRASSAPVYDDNNLLSGMIEISADITLETEKESLLKQYMHDLERSNDALRKIAWTQSHVVRAPIARILGIINLIELQNGKMTDLLTWLEQLKISTLEMDAIVKKIVDEANLADLK